MLNNCTIYLGNSNSPAVGLVYERVGEHEVNQRLRVHAEAEVLVVVPREALADAAAVVQHGGDTIKPTKYNKYV